MKKIILLVFSCCCYLVLHAQNKIACCDPASATMTFASFSHDKDFINLHPSPATFHYAEAEGKMISYRTPDDTVAQAYLIRSTAATKNYILVFHEWWGLNDYIKRISDSLHDELGNVNVLALDLYDGKVASTPQQAAQYVQQLREPRARAIVQGALNFAGNGAEIATIGWCFGGGWSLQAAIMAGDNAVACVMYYGMPEKDISQLKKLHTDVLGIFANKDHYINPKIVDQFKKNMKRAGKKIMIYRYDADHAFANPSGQSFNSAAAKDAYQKTINYLKQKLSYSLKFSQ